VLVLVRVEAGAVRGRAAAVVGLEEAVADARALQAVDGGDVRVALARVGERAGRVVVVEAVAPLVVEHGRDLAGVPAAPARAVEVHVLRGRAPERVAGLVDVHVRRELALQPGVRGQPAPGLLGQLVELVEARARGRRVTGRGAGRRAVVLVVGPAQVDGAGGVALADGAA